MKILHTGDWHAGRGLNRVSRLEETRAALSEIADIAANENVDCVVVCGDVFESSSPSADAEQVVYEALLRFGEQGCPVVLLAGNHDNPGRWQALAPLFQRFDIHVVSDLRPPERGGIVEIRSRDGRQTLQVAAVPWVTPARLYTAVELMGGGEKTYQTYADGMARAIRRLCGGFTAGDCHLLAAHIFVSGSVPSGTERPLSMGEIFAIAPNAIPPEVQYAALGHVHRPQKAPGVAVPARYAGSILQMDFGETGQEKGVVIAELEPNRPAKVRQVPILAGRRLLKLPPCTLEELERYQNDSDGTFLHVTLKCDSPQLGLSDRVREILGQNVLTVALERSEQSHEEAFDVRSKTPRELFEGYLGAKAEPALLDLFDSLYHQVNEGAGLDDGQLRLALDAPTGAPVAPASDPPAVDERNDAGRAMPESGPFVAGLPVAAGATQPPS